jgi:hypothetical protein
MTHTVFGKLQDRKWAAAIFVATMLAALALVLMAGPANAIDDDPCPDCEPPANNPPTVAADNGSRTVPEGQPVTNTGTYSDADGNATVTLSASVGSVTKNSNGTWNWSFNTSDGPDQSQTVTITANDGTDTATTTFSLTVNNVAPTVNLQSGGFSSVPEGGAFANGYSSYGYNLSVSDPGNDTWSLSTGCGANGSEWQESQFQVWCGFFDGPGSSVVSATATDSDGHIGNTATVNVNVTNRNPDAAFNAPTSINEGSAATISLTKGNFSTQDGETDTNAGFHYAFDCNGGSLTTANYGNSSTANSVNCPTTDNGTKTVRARIIDKDNGFNEYTKSITVNNVAPTATFNAPTAVNQGNNFTISLGSIVDPSSAETFTYAFDCGDGSGYGPATTSPSKSDCPAIDTPNLTVKGKVMDDDGGSNEYTANVTVNNVYPTGTIQINNNAAATNNAAVNLSLSANDPLPGSDMGDMRFRNENTATWSTWQPYAPSRAWSLSSGDGTKTVFVEYKDNAGNVSQGVISDQIVLDTTDFTAPTVETWLPKGKKVKPTAKPTVTFSEKMDKTSVEAIASGKPTTFVLKKGSTVIPATVAYTESGTTFKAVLTPTKPLKRGAKYTATVTTAATDVVGNALVAKTWTFTVKG